MRLIDFQHETLRLVRQEGLSAGKISARLRKIAKEAGQEPVPTVWVRAWLRNAGLTNRTRGGRGNNFNVRATESRGVR
jgi:nicotinamidase-related amidase